MLRVRVAAALLAGFTFLVAALFTVNADVGRVIVASCALAALCLIAIVPFRARRTVARKRVFVACAVYICIMCIALVLGLLASASLTSLGTLAALLMAGVVLTIWSYKARRRRSGSAWADYFDN